MNCYSQDICLVKCREPFKSAENICERFIRIIKSQCLAHHKFCGFKYKSANLVATNKLCIFDSLKETRE